MIRLKLSIVFVVLCCAMQIPVWAQKTIMVPQDQSTLQGAINAASNGDLVSVSPGSYQGPFDFKGKAITVSGTGPGVILDGGLNNGPVVSFKTNEGRNSILENVTVQDGVAAVSMDAGGIYISGASPTIRNSVIQNNKGCGFGVYNGAPLISGNTITGNTAAMYSGCVLPSVDYSAYLAGGILLFGLPSGTLNAEIIGNTITSNSVVYGAGGISAFNAGQPLIQNNRIAQNLTHESGAGMFISGNTAPIIIQNLIFNNTTNPTLTAPDYSGGAGLLLNLTDESMHSFKSVIVNNTFVGNKILYVAGTRQAGTQAGLLSYYDNVEFFNNLIIGTDAQTPIDCEQSLNTPVNPPTFDHNDVSNMGLSASVYSGSCSDQTGKNGNISADPNFVKTSSTAYPYQLQLPSPAIDSGNNNAPDLPQLDFAGQPRLQNATGLPQAIIDMGVYEYPGIPGVLPPPPPPPPPPPTQNFSVITNPTSLTLQTEHHGNVAVTVTPSSGTVGAVSLGCVGLPAHASCTFKSPTLNITGDTPQSTVLTVDTSDVLGYASNSGGLTWSTSPLSVLCLLFPGGWFLIGMKRKKGAGDLLMVLLIEFTLMGLSGCSGKYPASTPPGTYTFTVTATDSTQATAKAVVTLIVTP